ncbi:MAG: hypothetical protein AMS22_05755 [Thiotrichales bacterium SG8_50]|nr:MAG: hypothetical protein AMS22_05755 [Thiotrichales bacterium SG8_50]
MDKHVLVASRSDDLRSQICERLEEAAHDWGYDLLTDQAANLHEAERRVERTGYDLIVSEVELPLDRQSSPEAGKKLGCELLKRLRERKIGIPVVLIGVSSNLDLQREIQKQAAADFVALDFPNWDDWVVDFSRKFLTRIADFSPLSLDVDIVLHPADCYTYRMQLHGRPGSPETGPLHIERKKLERLGQRAPTIPTLPEWEGHLAEIGETLGEQIFQKNYEFTKRFRECLGAVQNKKNVNIRFVVEKDVHPVTLEALKEAGERFWMLEAPVYRRVTEYTDRPALFQDDETKAGPINCLIIKSEVGDVIVPKLGARLKPLKNVPLEAASLSRFLEKPENRERFRVGHVEVLDAINGETVSVDQVRQKLKERKWHIVHYAGHSYYDAKENKGYVFFPGIPVISITAAEFSQWLNESGVRFLYLSSCHSSEADFVFELAHRLVPAVLGFRWDLDDVRAAEFTSCFYRHLFEAKSLERAFLETRRDMHDAHSEDPIWAAPILVVQTMN